MRWSVLLPSSSRDGSHCPSIISYSIHEPERLEQSDQRIPPISTLSERVRNPQKQKRSSVLRSRKRPMSPQGVWVRGDAKFPLSQCLRSSSQLKWERRETSHRCFRVWFKNHTDVCNRAITPHSILLGLFCRCWSALETLCAGSAGAEGKGLERCAALTRSLRALQGCQKEPSAQWISATQRRLWQLSCRLYSVCAHLLTILNILQVHLSGIA